MELINLISKITEIPLIAHGGIGRLEDFNEAFNYNLDAIALSSVLHYNFIDNNDFSLDVKEGNTEFLKKNVSTKINKTERPKIANKPKFTDPINIDCPIKPGRAVDPTLLALNENGETVAVCCESCVDKFKSQQQAKKWYKYRPDSKNAQWWLHNYSKKYGAQFYFDFSGMKNRNIIGTEGLNGQNILIDLDNSRIVITNSAATGWNVRTFMLKVIKDGKLPN